jgi:hypothetical protein
MVRLTDEHKLARVEGVNEPGLGTTNVRVSPVANVPVLSLTVKRMAELALTVVGDGTAVTEVNVGIPSHERH